MLASAHTARSKILAGLHKNCGSQIALPVDASTDPSAAGAGAVPLIQKNSMGTFRVAEVRDPVRFSGKHMCVALGAVALWHLLSLIICSTIRPVSMLAHDS